MAPQTPSLIDSELEAVLEFLTQAAGFTANQSEGLLDRWRSEAEGDEDAVAFFSRVGVLSPAAPILFGLNGWRDSRGPLGRVLGPAAGDVADLDIYDTKESVHQRDTVVIGDEPVELTPGDTLGPCRLLNKVGEGAFGVVYEAYHQTLNLSVAVKVLRPNRIDDPIKQAEAFSYEARLLARLNHPNIVRVWDFDADPARPYLVMEYIDGMSLDALIANAGRLSPERVARVGAGAARGLAEAAKAGLVHRDVKPANILIDNTGTARVVDLGLSFMISEGYDGAPKGLIGTAAYVSPEQARDGNKADSRSDIYSLGVTLYHALTGRVPFKGANPIKTLLMHANAKATPAVDLVPEAGEEMSGLIDRMLAKNPEDRPSYAEIIEVLGRLSA